MVDQVKVVVAQMASQVKVVAFQVEEAKVVVVALALVVVI